MNPRQSRGFFLCGQSPMLLACASRCASTVCQPREFCHLLPVNGFLEVPHRQLFSRLIFFQLAPDVLLYLFRIFPCRVYVVPSAPELPVSILIFQFRILFVNHQAALPFQIPHKTRYAYLRRYLQEHMHMIRAHLNFYNFHVLPFA